MRLKLIASLVAVSCLSSSAIGANRSDPDFVPPNLPRGTVVNGGAACPGQTIAALPFSDSGTTCDGTNTVTNYNSTACLANLNFPYPGPDTVYSVTLGAGNNVAFSADLTGSPGDLALFLLSTCGTGSSCIDTSQDAIGAGAGPEDIAAASYTPGTYFLYVDSYYASGGASCGTYTLNVTGTVPVELESFEVM